MKSYPKALLSKKNLTGVALISALAGAAAIVTVVDAKAGPHKAGPMEHMMMLDANGDGVITEAELDARKEKLLSEADANGDRSLSKEELQAHKEKKMAERNPDKDGDGLVTLAEFQAAAAKRFEKMDDNGDGVLSKDELPKRGKWGKWRHSKD